MITGPIKNQIDQIWNAFWSGGISNPLEVIEQITYLLFLRRLDDLHTLEENKSARLKKPMARRVFPEGKDAKKRRYEDFRWSRFKHFAPAEIYAVPRPDAGARLRAAPARSAGIRSSRRIVNHSRLTHATLKGNRHGRCAGGVIMSV